MSTSKHIVVGAGLAGAAVAWRLADRGEEVTLLDRRAPAAPDGSSHGSARIFRYAYPERRWTDLVVRSMSGWVELQREHGAPLITPTGAVDHGETRDPRGLAAVLAEAGVEHELVPRSVAQQRWPQMRVETDVLHHPGAGVIDAETAVHAMVAAAENRGAQVLTGWEMARLVRDGAGFHAVAVDGRQLDAGSVVVCAGGWLPDLLDGLALPAGFRSAFPSLEVREENAFHFPYAEQVAPAASWPTSIHKSDDLQVYSLPGGRDAAFRGQKVARYNAGRRLRSAAEQSGSIDPANRAAVVDYVRRWLPGLMPEPYAEATCLFTNTPSEDFVIDAADGVTIVSPCSGHGAKFAPVIGEFGAEAALGRSSAPAPFRVGSRADA